MDLLQNLVDAVGLISLDIRLNEINGIYEYGLSEVSIFKPVRYRCREDNELDNNLTVINIV